MVFSFGISATKQVQHIEVPSPTKFLNIIYQSPDLFYHLDHSQIAPLSTLDVSGYQQVYLKPKGRLQPETRSDQNAFPAIRGHLSTHTMSSL